MTFRYSTMPSLFIILYVCLGMICNAMLDIQLHAILLISCSFLFALCTIRFPLGKSISAFLLGMCIQSEARQMQIVGKEGYNLLMKGIVKGKIVETMKKKDYMQCIIRGYIDTPELPRIENCKILLRIQTNKAFLKEGMYIQVQGIASNPKKAQLAGEFNQLRFMQSKDIQFVFSAKEKDIAIIHGQDNDVHSGVQKIRDWIAIGLSRIFPSESLALAKGLLIGETSDISKELRGAFALVGTAHILSVSGFHAGIIALMIQFVLSWIPSHLLRNILLGISLIVFLSIIQWDPPAIRACMMTSLVSALHSLQRKAHPLHILLLIGGLMIAFEPSLLFSIGFQMSMMGMLGLIVLPSFFFPIHQKLFPQAIAQSLSTSLSATLILLPMTAWYFHMISLVGPLANLIFIPLFTIALSWTLMALIFYSFSISIAEVFAFAAHQMIMLAQELHILFAKMEGIAYQGEFSLWIAIFLIVIIILIYRSKTLMQAFMLGLSSIIFLIGMHDIFFVLKPYSQKQIQIFKRNDIIVGLIKGNVLLMDRDIHRFRGRDKPLLEHIVQAHKTSTVIVSGRISKTMALSIQKVDTTIQIKECNRERMKLCLTILQKSIPSRE